MKFWFFQSSAAKTVLAGILLSLLLPLAYLGISGSHSADAWVIHTHQVIESLQTIAASLKDVQGEERSYLLSEDPEYLKHADEVSGDIGRELEHLSGLTQDNPHQQDRISELTAAVQKSISLNRETAALGHLGDVQKIHESLRQGTSSLEEVLNLIRNMQKQEYVLLAQRKHVAHLRLFNLGIIFVVFIALITAILIRLLDEIGVRQRGEEKLRGQTRILESILSSIGDGVIVSDAHGKLILFNPAAERILGAGPSEKPFVEWPNIYGLFEADQVTPLAPAQIPIVIAAKGTNVDYHESFIRNTAAPQGIWINSNARPLKDKENRIHGAVSVMRDITVQRQTQADLARSREALTQSQKLEAIGRLAGGIAHDFNNLLTGILGVCEELLNDPSLEAHRREDIAEIATAGKRASALTKQLLGFGRRQIAAPIVLNINSCVSELNKMLRRLIGEDIELTTILDPRLGCVKADPGQIEQVLVNLVLNSRDAMPGGGKITVETANAELGEEYVRQHFDVRAGSYILLAVSDTGKGMDQTTQSHIFEPFFTTKEKDKGTGLGLATVYGIVKQNGGDIFLYSTPGAGTTVKIYIPRVFETAESGKRPITHPSGLTGTETVLLVEDEDIVRRVAKRALSKQGYKVLEARHAKDALEICSAYTDPIHLMLTDVVMPGMNGQQLAEILLHSRPTMKVLYMSGYTENIIVTRGILKPGIAFIEKSFTGEALGKKVRELIDTASIRTATA